MTDPKLLWIALGSALVGGLAGGAAGRLSSKPPVAAAAATREPAASGEGGGALEKRVAELEQKLAASERSRRVERMARQAATDPEGADAGAVSPPKVDDPVFEAAVRDVVEQMEDERREARETRRSDRQRQVAERMLENLSTELALSDAQRKKVADIISEFYDNMRALRDSDAGVQTRGEWRDKMRAERDKAEGKLGQVLDSGQLEKYKGLENDKKLGFGGGGRRPARGD
ncbi:MAG: hypothetical protein U0263_28740 [Polyangiaceae bacterium]